MSNLVLSREIYSPLEKVFAYHTELANAPEYWANLSECRREDGRHGVPTPGTRYAWRYNMLGRQFSGHFTVAEVVEGERFTFDADGQIRARFRHDYRATAKTRTRVTVIVDYEVPGIIRKAVNSLFVEHRNAADAEHALDQLKEHLEAEAMAKVDAGVI